jgi:chromate transporter
MAGHDGDDRPPGSRSDPEAGTDGGAVTDSGGAGATTEAAVPSVPFGEALRAWVAVAAASFGGPAGQVAVMHEQVVERRGWVDDGRFLNALNYTMLLPGPEAHQLAVYLGWLLHGTRGGLVAGTLFVAPGFLSMLVFGVVYVLFQSAPLVPALFFGLKAAVLAVVALAVLRLGRRTLSTPLLTAVAAGAFVAMYAYGVPFPVVVIGAGLLGWAAHRLQVRKPAFPDPPAESETGLAGERPVAAGLARRPTRRGTLRTAAVWTVVWLAPLAGLVVLFGPGGILVTQGVFFGGVAAVSFGGAYAALAFVAQQAVDGFGWLSAEEMLDGIGVAEPLPGPLIKVVQFVAFLGAFRNPGGLDPIVAGLLGAIVAGWFTYLPSYLWIFVGAPYVEALRNNEALSAALSAVTAAVVGVIANLGAWFGVQVLFAERSTVAVLGAGVELPVLATIDPAAAAIAVAAGVTLAVLDQPIPRTLAGAAAVGVLLF